MRSLSSNNLPGLLIGVWFGVTTPASAAPVHCPEQLTVQQRAIDLPAGLQAYDSSPRHLWVNVQFSDGTPDEQAWLAPDDTRSNGKSFVSIWRFTPSGRGIWLSCSYTGTSMVATFRLANAIRVCEVRYDANFSPPAATAIDCR